MRAQTALVILVSFVMLVLAPVLATAADAKTRVTAAPDFTFEDGPECAALIATLSTTVLASDAPLTAFLSAISVESRGRMFVSEARAKTANTVLARCNRYDPKHVDDEELGQALFQMNLTLFPFLHESNNRASAERVAGLYELDKINYDNRIAITIDEPFGNDWWAEELDALKKYNVHATFFLVTNYLLTDEGRLRPRTKELLLRTVAEGHELGDHSVSHPYFNKIPKSAIGPEIEGVQSLVDKILGYHYPLRYFRPPYGVHDAATDAYLLDTGRYCIQWSITAYDWAMNYDTTNPAHRSKDFVIKTTLDQAKSQRGGVLLLHGTSKTAAMFDELLKKLTTAEGGAYRFVTIGELLQDKYRK